MHSDIHNITTCHTHKHTHLQTNSKVIIPGPPQTYAASSGERWRDSFLKFLPFVLSTQVAHILQSASLCLCAVNPP